MKLHKTLYEQQFDNEDPKLFKQQEKYGKYEPSFAYLGDAQFRGQYIELSEIVLEPKIDFISMAFYQEQINLNLKLPISKKSKSMVKKIIEIENKNIKTVHLPKIESQKTIVIQIKNKIEMIIARLPNQLQTTKTSFYNKTGQLVGFLSYKMKEVNANNMGNQQNEYQYQFDEDLDEQLLRDKEQNPKNVKQSGQQKNIVEQNTAGGTGKVNQNQSINSENQFLPKQKQQQGNYPNENQLTIPKTSLRKGDDEENQKLQKHSLPKMILSYLLKQPKQQNHTQQIKAQTKTEPFKTEPHQTETVKTQLHLQQKEAREENKFLTKLRQMQNKTLAQKQKMKETQRIKQTNRFRIRNNQTSQEKKSVKDNLSDQEQDFEKVEGSKLYKIPVQLRSVQTQKSKNNLVDQKTDKKRISVNFPFDLGSRSFLQKHLKQFTPKNAQKNEISNKANIEDQKKIVRKPGFITPQKKTNQIRQKMREFISVKKKQEKLNEVQPIKTDSQQIKRAQTVQKQIGLSNKVNQKFKLAVSRNIIDIKVNQSVRARKLTKVINQSYLPKIQQKKEYAQKQISNPTISLQLNSFQNSPSQKQKTTFAKHGKLENQQLRSQYLIPIKSNYSYFDIIVNNLSVNLYSKAFGKKFVELSSDRQMHTTDSLHGSHLLWVNRGYLFKKALFSNFLYISLKSEADNHIKILGKAKININQLLLNYKQSFYQTYLHSPSDELLAVIIISYQIFKHLSKGNQNTSREQSINMPVTLAPKKVKTLSKGDTKNMNKLPVVVPEENSRKSQQKRNSQYRKYKGGHNIRMQRASRFTTEYTDDEPGPGYYNLISDFDRHTVSRKEK